MSVFTVTTLADSGVGSLRAAISATSNGDTIDFASSLSGIVDLTTAGDSSAGPAAFGITDSITIDGSASPSGITIERDNSASDMRLFNIASGASLTLVNVTLANGIAQGGDGGDGYWSGGAGAGLGGAIFNQGTLTIKGSTFDSNQAVGGAAVAYNDNPGGGGGGGLDGTPADSDASNGFGAAGAGPNGGAGGTASAAGAAGGFGGGGGGGAGFNLNASDQAAGNGGFGGGGGAAGDGSDSDSGANGGFGGGGGGGGDFPSVNDGSGGFGGGNAMFGVGGAGGGMGGAVFNDAGTVVISNSTFTANSAVGGAGTSGSGNGDGYGGAIFNLDGSTTVTNATLSSNTAAQGGTDIYNLANGVVASVAANNSIMGQTSNSVTDFVDDSEGASASSSGVGDLIRSTTTFSGTNVSASDPLLGALANNGGLTDTLLPGAGSPAIDAGNNTAASGLSTDQRGDTRIINSVVDIGSVEVQSSTVAPTITSVTTSTFTVGSTGAFTVTTTGTPTAALSEIGSLPGGVNFTDNGNGTATITGIPAAASGADYDLTITAANGVTPNAQQSFTLVVDQAPAITSATAATFTVGTSASFTVTSTGFPTAAMTESGAFPAGLNWTDNGNGTGTISGIPNPGTGADLSVTMNASNGVSPDVHQPFTLIVDQAPAITSAASDSIAAGSSASFTVTTTGFPAAAISELGSVPTGMTFTDNGDGTATLAGTAAATATGVYTLTLGANNGTAPAASQTFTLTVDGAPSIISAASTTFTAGTSGTFAVHATGFPTAAIAEIGHLPTGVTLTDNGNGTATLGGTPADGTGGSYPITIQAANGTTPDFDQSFTLTVATPPPVVVAANVNGQEVLDVNNPDGTTRFTITPFPNAAYTQLNVALADQNGSGIDDIIVGAGPGGAPRVKIYNSQTGVKVAGFLAFGSNFHGGVNVAAGDVNDDGISDIIVGKGSGGPRVRVFNGSNLALMDNFLAFTVPGYTGGVRVAAADLNGDGHADVVAATGPGTRADVAIYDGAALASDTASETTTFYAFGTIFDGGAYVATGDVNGDGTPDIIVSKGPGGGPRVKVFSGTDDSLIQNFLVYSSSQTNGITVAAGNTNGDADADIITATGPGIAGQVRVYNGVDDSILQQYNIGNTDGLWVADAEL